MSTHGILDRTLAGSFAPAILAASCAAPRGTFQPLDRQHPASPAAEEGDIRDPGRTLAAEPAPPAAQAPATQDAGETARVRYVCQMHPDVVSDQPGKCPRCGMALKESAPGTSGEPRHDR